MGTGYSQHAPGWRTDVARPARRTNGGRARDIGAAGIPWADETDGGESEAGARAQHLLQAMHAALLSGHAADAIVHAAELAAIALGPPNGAGLGAQIDRLRRAGRTGDATDAAWLYQRWITSEPLVGSLRPEHDADARRASTIARRLAEAAGLVTAEHAEAAERAAAWQASVPASSAVLRLDRAGHRKVIEDWLERSQRVLVALIHGEVGQGHDHFATLLECRLRRAWRRWRAIDVQWPSLSPNLGNRFAPLLVELARSLDIDLDAPPGGRDPLTPDGARAWQPALNRMVAAIDAAREPLLLRHVVGGDGRLGRGAGGDAALVDAYLRKIWAQVADRPGAQVVLSLDLLRGERARGPWSRAWWSARRDLGVTRAAQRMLDLHRMPHGACLALPELTSVTEHDLRSWLDAEAELGAEAARAKARQLVASTRGGRFDAVVKFLSVRYPDRPRNPRRTR